MFRRREGRSEPSTVCVGEINKTKGLERCTRKDTLGLVGSKCMPVGVSDVKWSSHFVDFETQDHMLK